MNLDDYQKEAAKTADGNHRYERAILGICGEAGEIAECCKKHLRGDYGKAEFMRLLRGELGDLLWYVAETCTCFGFSMSAVARLNIDKLRDRALRGVISGSGDER